MFSRDIIDHIAAFVGVMDRDGTVLDINEATLRVAGASREDVVGRKLWDCCWFRHDPQEAARVRDAVERAARGEAPRFDVTTSTGTGDLLVIDLMIQPLRDADGRITRLVPSGLDITRRKRIEIELRHGLDFQERAQRIGHIGYWSYQIDTEALVWSDEARRIYFGDEPVEASREIIEQRIHPDDLERLREAMKTAIKVRERLRMSYRIRRPDGEERIVEIEADPDYTPDGEPLRVFGILRDVTEARLRERKIVEQQQLIDLSLEPTLCWEIENGLVIWNPGCRQIYGYSRDEALGRTPDELLVSEFPLPFSEIKARLCAGKTWAGEIVQTTRDGRRVIVEALIQLVESAGRRLVLEAHRDVTARRQAEQRLKVSEERLAIAADLTGLGSFDHDHASGLVYFTGGPWGRALSAPTTMEDLFAIIHPADLAGFREAVARAHDPAGDGLFEHDYRVIRKSGEVRWISVKARTFFEGKGPERRAVRTIGAALDVTDRRTWEDRQRLLMSELNHRVRNTLSVVQAIAAQTLRNTKDPRTFVADFNGRIQAMANAHKLLNETTWQGANLTRLIREQSAANCDAGQISSEGPEVWLPPQVALNLGLVLHELATNARKYGALSVPGGLVEVTWEVLERDDKHVLRLTWRESGGPPVRPPEVRGFGTGLIERSVGNTVEGATRLRFDPEGLSCVIDVTL
ncbi:MAG: PAS domain S-box protein [Hyphomicrobiaceae bacterium]|nr:PAS domain S-box protein [Hyphomicrobiaceae bacterium]